MEEASIKRIPPHDLEAEKSVIGSMIIDKEALVTASELLSADDFYAKQNGMLFEAMLKLYQEGKPIDMVTLSDRLKQMDAPVEISGLEYVREILGEVFTAAFVKDYCEIVYNNSLKRQMIHLSQELERMCYDDKDLPDYIMDSAEKKVYDLVAKRKSLGDYVPIRQVVKNAIEKIGMAAKNDGVVTGVATGFSDLDYKTAGLQPSDLILVAARPSMGKTAFVLNIAQHVCFKDNRAAVIFSLEMSKEQLVNRLLSLESGVDSKSIRNGSINAKDWEGLIEGASVIGESNLIIDDTPGISVSELTSKCRKYKKDMNISLVIIDYLQLMSGSGKSESRVNEIGDISRALKALARDINVPVIALSQLSRAVEKRDDHRPMLSDLRDSGAIEQDADVVMFLYRDDYYNKESEKKGIAEVIIAKQRNGPIGTTELVWLPDLTKFANLAKEK